MDSVTDSDVLPDFADDLRISEQQSALLTDLYQLTMLDAYLARDMCESAVFEFFSRRLPENRSFLMAAGLEQLLDYLEALSINSAEIEWLESTGLFSSRLLEYLADFRFRGDVYALPEGTVFFENEPIVQVVASLPEAQLVETRLINLIHFSTLIASKGARCVMAAPGKTLVDFGLRRAHGAEAGMLAARASYIAGFAGTSNVLARARFDIPIYGTMAHSFVQAHKSEMEALEHFARTYPDASVLLIDTYDTLVGAERVVRLIDRLRPEGIRVGGVRLDSGELSTLAAEVRKILDDKGCSDVSIFCSGSLDEYSLARDFTGETPADGFGIGTHLDVSADAPYLDCAYKIQEYAGQPRRKRSAGKSTWPGRKQVYRSQDSEGRIQCDLITLADEQADGRALLECVMRGGIRVAKSPGLGAVRDYAASELASLPGAMSDPFSKTHYPVEISTSLRGLVEQVDSTFV
jgi:nicotinate phosphoribosyltransferase